MTCKGCDRHVDECGPLSARYLCQECGEGALLANRRHLIDHAGEFFHRWRRGVAASVGATLLDDLEPDD